MESLASDISYFPLTDRAEIRLIALEPRSASEDLQCTIKHVKLNDRPNYEALSYMWGSKGIQKSVLINSDVCLVRENLCSALQHLRLAHEERLLWVDAVCS